MADRLENCGMTVCGGKLYISGKNKQLFNTKIENTGKSCVLEKETYWDYLFIKNLNKKMK